jgi:hypothetical protein
VRAIEILSVQKPAFPFENLRPREISDPIVYGVAQNCRDGEQHEQKGQTEPIRSRGDCANREQERVSWQNRRDHEPGLAEDNQKEYDIDPRAKLGDDLVQVLVQVQDNIDKFAYEVHRERESIAMVIG